MDASHSTQTVNIYNHRTLVSWLESVASFRQDNFLLESFDDPRKLLLGFEAAGTDKSGTVAWERHFIHLRHIKGFKEDLTEVLESLNLTQKELGKLLTTREGREELLTGISKEELEAGVEAMLEEYGLETSEKP